MEFDGNKRRDLQSEEGKMANIMILWKNTFLMKAAEGGSC